MNTEQKTESNIISKYLDNKDFLKFLGRNKARYFWGTECKGSDTLINKVHGDGKQIMYIQPLANRPFCYLVRVDSLLDLTEEDENILTGKDKDDYYYLTEMIIEYIEEEFGDMDEDGLGYSWGDAKEYILDDIKLFDKQEPLTIEE